MTEARLWLPLEAQAIPVPEWIRLLPLGRVELSDDREGFETDAAALAGLVADFEARGVDLVVDYEHQSMTGDRAPAAGWIKELRAMTDGLWARVEWTDQAQTYLRSREYRYFSPVLRLEPATRRPVALLSVALTNTPAMRQVPPLVLKAQAEADREARSKKYGIGVKEGGALTKPGRWQDVPEEQWGDPVNWRYPMPDAAHARSAWSYWNQKDNQAQYNEAERKIIEQRIKARAKALGVQIAAQEAAKMVLEQIKALLGAKPEATEEEVLELADRRLKGQQGFAELAEVLGLKAEASPGEIKAAVLALKQAGDRLGAVETELAALKGQVAEQQAQGTVDEALAAGKITPAQRDWALDYARKDLAGFKAFAEKAPKVVPLDKLPPGGMDQGGGVLSPAELQVCRQMGLDAEAFAAEKKKLAQAGG